MFFRELFHILVWFFVKRLYICIVVNNIKNESSNGNSQGHNIKIDRMEGVKNSQTTDTKRCKANWQDVGFEGVRTAARLSIRLNIFARTRPNTISSAQGRCLEFF